jgi:hypothetical protein
MATVGTSHCGACPLVAITFDRYVRQRPRSAADASECPTVSSAGGVLRAWGHLFTPKQRLPG